MNPIFTTRPVWQRWMHTGWQQHGEMQDDDFKEIVDSGQAGRQAVRQSGRHQAIIKQTLYTVHVKEAKQCNGHSNPPQAGSCLFMEPTHYYRVARGG